MVKRYGVCSEPLEAAKVGTRTGTKFEPGGEPFQRMEGAARPPASALSPLRALSTQLLLPAHVPVKRRRSRAVHHADLEAEEAVMVGLQLSAITASSPQWPPPHGPCNR